MSELLNRVRRRSSDSGRHRSSSGKMSPNRSGSPLPLFPPGLQQMHQLLQSQLAAGGGPNPAQLQHFMQQHHQVRTISKESDTSGAACANSWPKVSNTICIHLHNCILCKFQIAEAIPLFLNAHREKWVKSWLFKDS